MKWTQSGACSSRAHCRACLSDDLFRASILRSYEWDGQCPYGVTIDSLPLPVTVAQGPGTELKRLLATFGIHSTGQCGCMIWAAQMDSRGVDWSREHLDEIAAAMVTEAQARGWRLPAMRSGARALVRLAIWRSKRKARQPS